jgi:hypothetical protein
VYFQAAYFVYLSCTLEQAQGKHDFIPRGRFAARNRSTPGVSADIRTRLHQRVGAFHHITADFVSEYRR